jgi:hypothetical protein
MTQLQRPAKYAWNPRSYSYRVAYVLVLVFLLVLLTDYSVSRPDVPIIKPRAADAKAKIGKRPTAKGTAGRKLAEFGLGNSSAACNGAGRTAALIVAQRPLEEDELLHAAAQVTDPCSMVGLRLFSSATAPRPADSDFLPVEVLVERLVASAEGTRDALVLQTMAARYWMLSPRWGHIADADRVLRDFAGIAGVSEREVIVVDSALLTRIGQRYAGKKSLRLRIVDKPAQHHESLLDTAARAAMNAQLIELMPVLARAVDGETTISHASVMNRPAHELPRQQQLRRPESCAAGAPDKRTSVAVEIYGPALFAPWMFPALVDVLDGTRLRWNWKFFAALFAPDAGENTAPVALLLNSSRRGGVALLDPSALAGYALSRDVHPNFPYVSTGSRISDRRRSMETFLLNRHAAWIAALLRRSHESLCGAVFDGVVRLSSDALLGRGFPELLSLSPLRNASHYIASSRCSRGEGEKTEIVAGSSRSMTRLSLLPFAISSLQRPPWDALHGDLDAERVSTTFSASAALVVGALGGSPCLSLLHIQPHTPSDDPIAERLRELDIELPAHHHALFHPGLASRLRSSR